MYAVNPPLLISTRKALGTRLLQSDILHWFTWGERTDNHVTAKVFQVDGLPNFLSNGNEPAKGYEWLIVKIGILPPKGHVE